MRHNQNSRRPRGRNGGGHGGGGHHHHHHNSASQQSGRRVNPRVQNFDSNGPEVRIRGTAYQINEKYVTLARDAASAGDRVLAESYLQHAEHYQRFINEMTEEFNQYQQQQAQQHPSHMSQPVQGGGEASQPAMTAGDSDANGLNDLDQGFLVGPRHGVQPGNGTGGAEVTSTAPQQQSPQGADPAEQPQGEHQGRQRGRHYTPRRNESEAV